MYQVIDNCAYINGEYGKYNGKISDKRVAYGRNATANFIKYLSDYRQPAINLPDLSNLSKLSNDEFQAVMDKFEFEISKHQKLQAQIPPLNFNYQYSKNGFDPYSLIASSYQEMGAKETTVENLTKEIPIKDETYTSDASVLDLNNDGKIDLAEYSTFTMLEDALDDSYTINCKNIDGIITNTGSNRAVAYQLPQNKELVKPILKQLYVHYNLGEVQKEFLENANNLIA